MIAFFKPINSKNDGVRVKRRAQTMIPTLFNVSEFP